MRRPTVGLVGLLTCLVCVSSPGWAWQANLGGESPCTDCVPPDLARGVAVDDQGDVVAAGTLVTEDLRGHFSVAKLAGSDGGVEWLTRISGLDSEGAAGNAVIVDSRGRPGKEFSCHGT